MLYTITLYFLNFLYYILFNIWWKLCVGDKGAPGYEGLTGTDGEKVSIKNQISTK